MKQRDIYSIITQGVLIVLLLLPLEMKGVERYPTDTIVPPTSVFSDDIISKDDTIHTGQLPESYKALKKNRWTKNLFKIIVREPTLPNKIDENKSIADDYRPFVGKIIRDINIRVLDPFGTDVQNPDYRAEDIDIFNTAHVSTQTATVRSLIQFRRGDKVNPAIIADSEAQLRKANYINDARISIEPVAENEDMVDVMIVVRDRWTIGLDVHSLSTSRTNLEVFDKNILGTGSRAGINFIHSTKYDQKFGFGVNYLYSNVARTQMNMGGSYEDKIRSHSLSLSVTRKLQPKLNYFGEITYTNDIQRPEFMPWDSITPDKREQFSITIGRAFTLSEEKAIRRLAIALRFKQKSPEFHNMAYHDYMKDKVLPYRYVKNRIWLMQMSLYQNSYQREYLVYNFGTTENIALGYNLSMQLGYSRFDDIDVKDGMYGSLSATYGTNKLTKGTLYAGAAISSFWNEKHPFESVLKLNLHYFTPLMRFSTIRFRQFLTLSYGKLLTPDRYFGDRIYMGEHTTLKMKEWREDRKGVELLLFKSETDMFSNYEVGGFRCLFYTFFDMGWIRQEGSLMKNENLNYGLGIGIRLRNEFVIFNTIDLKIGVYPRLDQSGFRSFFKVRSASPNAPSDFTPRMPEEILLEY